MTVVSFMCVGLWLPGMVWMGPRRLEPAPRKADAVGDTAPPWPVARAQLTAAMQLPLMVGSVAVDGLPPPSPSASTKVPSGGVAVGSSHRNVSVWLSVISVENWAGFVVTSPGATWRHAAATMRPDVHVPAAPWYGPP